MQPLIFLTVRSIVNGVKRAVTSGKRLVTLIFVILYYGFLVFRPIGSSRHPVSFPNSFHSPTPAMVDGVIFAVFGALSILLMLPILSPRGSFRQADVDVLFATPVSPKAVMFFRMLRDYLITLLTPLFLMLFGGRVAIGGITAFLGGMHAKGPIVERIGGIAWFLMSFTWVCITYGVSFLVNRSDLKADRNKKVIDATIFIMIVGSAAYVVPQLIKDPTAGTFMQCMASPILRIAFFSGTAANWMVMGALSGQILLVLAGLLVFLVGSGSGILLALSQIPFMYDQAAVKGFGSSERRVLQRNNDMYGLSAQRAREGKGKVGIFSKWFGRMRPKGAAVLVWKEVLLQMRSGMSVFILLGGVQIAIVVLPVISLDPSSSPAAVSAVGNVLFAMQGVAVLMLTMNTAVSGFIELLKRVDFQKPLPFRPAGTVFWEVLSKCVPTIVMSTVASIAVTCLKPVLWGAAFGSVFYAASLSLLISATVFLVTIAFSDAGDSSQRGFRGILMLLGIVICGLPGGALLTALIVLLHLHPLLAAIPASAVNFGVALLVSFLAGGLYESYNPND